MQSSTTVEFTRTATTSPTGGDSAQITLMQREEDNRTALEVYEADYLTANNRYPDYSTRADRETYITLLEQSLKDSYTVKVRLYTYDAASLQVSVVRAAGFSLGEVKSELSDEYITVLGSSSMSPDYPVKGIQSLTMDLRDVDGNDITKEPVIGGDGNLYFETEVYGFIHITYIHEYRVINVQCSQPKAVDKLSSVIICKDVNSTAAIEVEYEDVIDQFLGTEPDKPNWKVTIRKGRKNFGDTFLDGDDEDNVVVGTVFTEQSRTVSPIEIEGVLIDRAETVTFKSEDGADLKLVFTSLNETTPQE
ncbi:hypothetical protein [Vibrio phage vB_VpS_PG28]|nr:hypothetical protein [Vibrio phage vB_VpS_PG28]